MAETDTPELAGDEAAATARVGGAVGEAGTPGAAGRAKEFRIVVRSQDRRGPLAPYRLTIAVAVVAVVFGPDLWAGVNAGTPDDGLLIRAGLIGILVWITTGIVSAALDLDLDAR